MIHLASLFDSGLTPEIVLSFPLLATVGLVFAGIGAASGVLNKPLQAAIIIMVILTTFVAPPLLRFAFQEEEQLVEQPVISNQ